MSPQTRTEIADLLNRHGLSPVHRLGQNFLADPNITRKILRAARVGPGDRVLEIGAGTGTLTRALADAGGEVVAYEIDEGLRPVLTEAIGDRDVDLRFRDVMKADLATEITGGPWKLVANLPYNVGTPVLLDAMRRLPAIEHFVVMVQAEVAQRLTAVPGGREYGLPSVIAGIHTETVETFGVPRQVFYPVPNVDSTVVVLERLPPPDGAEGAIELAAAAFNQRRKMLRRSLLAILEDPVSRLEKAGISGTARAEDISPSDYLRLAGT